MGSEGAADRYAGGSEQGACLLGLGQKRRKRVCPVGTEAAVWAWEEMSAVLASAGAQVSI